MWLICGCVHRWVSDRVVEEEESDDEKLQEKEKKKDEDEGEGADGFRFGPG